MGVINKIDIQRYLGKFGIDPNRVPIKGIGPAGFDYYVQDTDGRPVYRGGTTQLKTEYRQWPEADSYEVVDALLNGQRLDDLVRMVPTDASTSGAVIVQNITVNVADPIPTEPLYQAETPEPVVTPPVIEKGTIEKNSTPPKTTRAPKAS